MDLDSISSLLAKTPEEIFGKWPDAKKNYWKLAGYCHPDVNHDPRATDIFKALSEKWTTALDRHDRGIYGTSESLFEPIVVSTRKRTFKLVNLIGSGDLSDVYLTDDDKIFKIARLPEDNDLLEVENSNLKKIYSYNGYADLSLFFPLLETSLTLRDGTVARRANVFSLTPNLYNLEEVRSLYPQLDPRHMAWIYRRLLKALGFAHKAGLVHGAVLPKHILIEPNMHGLVLIDWCYSVPLYGVMSALPGDNESWYPDKVFRKEPIDQRLDIIMAAKCMVWLMGGDIETGRLPYTINNRLQIFFSSFWKTIRQPDNAWDLNLEFTELIDSLWPRKFRPLQMKGK